MFRKKSIDEWALDYWLLQSYAKIFFHLFYKKITLIGLQNIPVNQPVILAPNHQNALMDAMVFTCTTKFQYVFLARADIFKGKLLIRFLTSINIMPVYRIRDGINNVKRNDEVFEKTIQVLRNRLNPLIIFPEGNHGDKRKLRPLVKGLFRIAFMGQEEYKDQPGVKIIPAGIDYGHYQNFGTTLFINIGKPIEVSSYYNLYKENPVAGINKLKEDFSVALSKQMIDIQTVEYYELYMRLRTIYNSEMRKKMNITDHGLTDKFRADKDMIRMLDKELERNPQSIRILDEKVSEYWAGLKKHKLRNWILEKEKHPFIQLFVRSVFLFVSLPVFLFGIIHNWIPFAFTASRTKGIKDPQFHSSFKFVISMIAFPVMYIAVAVILAFFDWSVWIKTAYIISMPVAGILSFHLTIQMKKLWARLRFSWLVNKKDPSIEKLIKVRKSILGEMHSIIDKQVEK